MKLIRLLLKNSGKSFFIATIFSIFSGASGAGIIAVINYAIANLENSPIWLIWLFVSLCIGLWIFRFISWVLINRLAQGVIYDLRLEMTQRILNCPLQHLESLGIPKILATLTDDITAISTASIQLSVIIVNIAVLIGIFVYLLWLSPLLFFIVFICLILGFYLYQFLQKPGIEGLKKARQIQDVMFGHIRAVTEGVKELKLHRHRRIAFFKEDLEISASKYKKYRISSITVFAFAGSLATVLFFIPVGLMLFVFPKINGISTEIVSSYVLAILYLINPVSEVVTSLPQIAQGNVALNKIESLGISLSKQVIEPNFPTGLAFESDWTSLELVDITHTYVGNTEEHQFTLNNINLKFKPGELVFIVGGNGSGKSTLIKLITGLYIPNKGNILFDNRPVTNENREWYRQQFSVVFYDFYLFERLLGIEENSATEIQNYLIQLELERKVAVKDGILSTTNLSQGQRKRLALLTAYLENRPIYVFDEWASDQDPVFKEIFYHKLLPELKQRGKTVIVVSHDDRYFDQCDRIIKLDYGSVVENFQPSNS
ncbi:cyclic peptide export ABC transporter [Plectonema cf. radiosum LEGE 06105]|uniref:Cyclic peptide export ABC transporter n=1 Tax=Plectonema cf. radiosum LEGE 06105 TaxID=945769 RepID=A0A8J7JYR6_9CYAN|nr:cyclic peptide export ABC transporter [Plectonema radiosum]MBE9211621.1 cyclic peptide export ABC transporter [Plectonema cf. radiosum LEGE 06105]